MFKNILFTTDGSGHATVIRQSPRPVLSACHGEIA